MVGHFVNVEHACSEVLKFNFMKRGDKKQQKNHLLKSSLQNFYFLALHIFLTSIQSIALL